MKTIKFLGGFTLSFAILLFIITSCNTGSSTSIIDNKPEVGFTKVHTTNVGVSSDSVVAPVGEVNIEVNASSSSLLNPIEKVIVSVVGGTQQGEDDSAPFIVPITFSTEGEYELVAKAVDQNGRTSSEETIKVTIVANNSGTGDVSLSKPTVTWQSPNQGSTVSGTVILEVDVEDLNDLTISSDDGNITQLEFYAGSISLGNATSPERDKWRLAWDSTTASESGESFIDGSWELVAIATDDQGETGIAYQTIIVNNTPDSPELNAEIKLTNITPSPQVTVNCDANTNSNPSLEGCFSDVITVDVTVTDETGEAEVLLKYFNETQNEGNVIGKLSAWPYKFEFDTTNYKNGDQITFSAVITAGDYSVQGPISDEIVIYNEILPPELTIISPANGTEGISGLMKVNVAVDNLTGNDYTMDINGDNRVNHNLNPVEGILVEFLLQDGNGDNKLPVADERISDVNLIQTMFAELDKKYETPTGFDTSNYSNREYILKVSAQFKRLETGEVFTLTDSINVRTQNSGPVPPSVLILSPVNDPNGDPRTVKDPSDAYIVMQGTDDKGIVHMELEVFTGDLQYDETPSRFVQAFPTPVTFTKAALPINYNAHPYLPNSPANADYTVRVTTEDTDGNRTHQDTKFRLDRAVQSEYYLVQTGPIFIDAIGNSYVSSTLTDANAVATFEIRKTGGASLDGTERFDHLVQLDDEAVFRPYTNTSSGNSIMSIGLTEKDISHYMTAQVITDTGEVYSTNTLAVILKDVE